MLFNLPFLPDAHYCQLLRQYLPAIHSLHLSISEATAWDSRLAPAGGQPPAAFDELLASLAPVKIYALLNSRFYAPATYLGGPDLSGICSRLQRLLDRGLLTGLVFSDFYLLQALSDFAPALADQLEAVPSVNCMLDSLDKIEAALDLIGATRFKPPTKLLLDRSLNRKPEILQGLATAVKKRLPAVKLELLANEGCLYQCPFKPAHDAHIALANLLAANDTFRLNSRLGCIQLLNKEPAALFKSPLIRPEDVKHYEGVVDIIKLCGRTLGPVFLEHTFSAYLKGEYHGNLLALTDTMEWLSQKLYIDNQQLPADFFEQLTSCSRQCRSCSYCRELLARTASRLPFKLADWRRSGKIDWPPR